LIQQLPAMLGDTDVEQYMVARRWLHQDAGLWLDEIPWWPDFQLRLVRRNGQLRFPGTIHSSASLVRPVRLVDAPIYHLTLLLDSVAERDARLARYENIARGDEIPGGGTVNEVFYRPESFARFAPADVPAEDRELVAAVMEPDLSPPPCEGPSLLSPPAPTDREWALHDIAPDAYRARIECLERNIRVQVGSPIAVHVRVHNLGTERWPWDPDLPPYIRVGYRWRGPQAPEAEGRSLFLSWVAPGDSVVVPLGGRAPTRVGSYVLETDVVHENVRWFGAPCTIPVDVVDER
jgi:hypothetical protein